MPFTSLCVKNCEEAMSIKYNNMVYELRENGVDVTVLSLGEAFFEIPLAPFDDLPFPAIYHYTHSRGIPELRHRIAEYFLKEYGFAFNPDTDILITAGSKIAVHMALMAVVDLDSEVIVQEPAWVSYAEQVKLCRGVPVMVPSNEGLADYEKYVTSKTRCIIINNPQNPTGRVFSKDELTQLLQLARKHDLWLLADEAYSDFLIEGDRFTSLGSLDAGLTHSIVCNSISKNYGISGWRLGYAIANARVMKELLKTQQHLVTCPASILQYYVAKHFFEIIKITKPQIREVVLKRQRLAKYMDEAGLQYMPGTGTFYFMVSIAESRLASEEFCTRLLTEYHVSAVPGLGYGRSCDHLIRVSVGTESWERTTRGLDAIRRLIRETSER